MQPQQNTPVGVQGPLGHQWAVPVLVSAFILQAERRGPRGEVTGTGQNPGYLNAHPPRAPRKARLILFLGRAMDIRGF